MNTMIWWGFLCTFFMTVSLASSSWGLTITEPLPNSVYHPGDKVVVKAKPAASENVKAVWFTTSFTSQSEIITAPPYVFTFIINDFIGTEKISASAKLIDESIVEAEVEIKVVLPAGATLTSIKAPDHIFLYKMPTGSDANSIRIAETKQIIVIGVYSNGYQLDVHSASDGTSYASSDESIVTVDLNGKVTAQGVGTAMLTIRNGQFKAMTKVIVAKER